MSEDQWLPRFKQKLVQQDLAEATINGYLADLRYFCQWLEGLHDQPVDLAIVGVADIRAYRQDLVNRKRQKPATVNRRIQALRRLFLTVRPNLTAVQQICGKLLKWRNSLSRRLNG